MILRGAYGLIELVDFVLVIFSFLIATTINGVKKESYILPTNIKSYFSKIYWILILILVVYAIIKYIKIKKQTFQNPKIQQVQ